MGDQARRPTGSKWYRYGWWLVIAFLLAYALTRWYDLTLLPPHFDELVYLDRVDRIVRRHDVFIGLREDLRTGHLWVIALLWPLSPDRLWVGRLASTLAGLWAALGVYKSGRLLFADRRVGFIAALLYLIVPAALFYDRMALADSLLTACGVWILYGVAAHFLGGDKHAWIWLGPVMALAMLTKPNGFLFLAIPIIGYILLRQGPLGMERLAVRASPLLIGGGLALALMLPFLGDTQAMLLGKAGVQEVTGWLDLGQRFVDNLTVSAGWLVSLLSWPVTLLSLGGLVLALRSERARRPALYLALVILVPWLFFAVVSQKWYPRYLLPFAPLLALLAAYAVHRAISLSDRLVWRAALAAALTICLAPALITDFWLLADPARAALHPEERRQYVMDWPSGYGLPEVAAFVRQLAAQYAEINLVYNHKSKIMTGEGLDYYLSDPPANMHFEEFDPFEGQAIQKLNTWAAQRPTFVVLNTAHEKGLDDFILNPGAFPQARQVYHVTRPGGLTGWDIYEWVTPDAASSEAK